MCAPIFTNKTRRAQLDYCPSVHRIIQFTIQDNFQWETTIAEAHRSVWSLEKVSLCHLHVAIFGANEKVFFIYCSEERGLYCIIDKARLFDSLQTSQEGALNPELGA